MTEWSEKLNQKFLNNLPGITVRYFGGGDTKVEQQELLTPSQRAVLDALSGQILSQFGPSQQGLTPPQGGGGLFGTVFAAAQAAQGQGQGGQLRGVTPFQGLRPQEVPFGALQQEAFGLAGGLGAGIGRGIDVFGQSLGGFDPAQGQGLLQQGTQALQGATQPFDPQSVLSALEPGRQLALRTFERDIVPNLLERFGATSGQSGALNKSLAEAGQGLSLGLGAQAAGPLIQGQQSQLDRQLQGSQAFGNLAQLPGALAGQGTALGGQGIDLLSQLFNIGQQQRGFPQGLAGVEQQRFQEAQPFNNPFLSLLGPTLGTGAFQNVGVQQPAGFGTPLLQGLGTFIGSQGLSGLGGLLGTQGVGGMTSSLGAGSGLLGGLGGLAGGAAGLLGGLGGAAAGGIGSAIGGLAALI